MDATESKTGLTIKVHKCKRCGATFTLPILNPMLMPDVILIDCVCSLTLEFDAFTGERLNDGPS